MRPTPSLCRSDRAVPRAFFWSVAVLPPLFWLASLWFGVAHRTTFIELATEDNWLENGQAALLAVAVWLSGSIGWRLQRARRGWLACCYVLLTLVLFWAAGEEVSWGQRVFGLETPAWLHARNVQDELNLHNIPAVGSLTGRVKHAALIVVCVLAPILWRLTRPRRRWQLALWMPHPAFIPAWLTTLSYGWLRHWYLWTHPERSHVSRLVSKLQEPNELIFAAVIVAFLWWARRELAAGLGFAGARGAAGASGGEKAA